MTQRLNIASDINRASHRANTGRWSPGPGSHAHQLPAAPPPAPLLLVSKSWVDLPLPGTPIARTNLAQGPCPGLPMGLGSRKPLAHKESLPKGQEAGTGVPGQRSRLPAEELLIDIPGKHQFGEDF